MIQSGSILAAVLYFMRDIVGLVGSFFGGLASSERRRQDDFRFALAVLVGSLPTHRHAALVHERDCLDHMLESRFTIPDDLALARIPDSQGLGGSSNGRSTALGKTRCP